MFETQGILGILVRHKLQIKDSGITDGDNDQNVTIRALEE